MKILHYHAALFQWRLNRGRKAGLFVKKKLRITKLNEKRHKHLLVYEQFLFLQE